MKAFQKNALIEGYAALPDFILMIGAPGYSEIPGRTVQHSDPQIVLFCSARWHIVMVMCCCTDIFPHDSSFPRFNRHEEGYNSAGHINVEP